MALSREKGKQSPEHWGARIRTMAPISSPLVVEALSSWPNTLISTIHALSPRSPSSHHSTTTSPATRTLASLVKRQTIVAIPATYANQDSSPEPGTVAGIVLGSVGGVLFILWLLYTCFNLGGGTAASGAVEYVQRRSRSPPRRARRTESRSETVEVRRRSRTPPPPRSRRETIIIEENRRPAPVVEEREDDIVEVIEEHSPPPRRSRRVSGGYRTVDPQEFAGGDRPRRNVRR